MPDVTVNKPELEVETHSKPAGALTLNRSSSEELAGENLIDKINKRIAQKEFWFSLEFFPPRTASGAANLISKLEMLGAGNPLFCDVTWHPAGDPANLEKTTSSMKIASVMRNYCLLETMLHITCVNMNKATMKDYLDKAKSLGIRNLLALRGGIKQLTLSKVFTLIFVAYTKKKKANTLRTPIKGISFLGQIIFGMKLICCRENVHKKLELRL